MAPSKQTDRPATDAGKAHSALSEPDTRSPYETIIEVLTTSPALPPPEDLTSRIMARIRSTQEHTAGAAPSEQPFWSAGWRPLIWPHSTRPEECALCFMLAGFFLSIMSLVIGLGLRPLSASLPPSDWLLWQPLFILGLGLLLLFSGILFLMRLSTAWRTARLGAGIFMALTCLDALMLCRLPQMPFTPYGLMMFTLGALLLGIFLLMTVQHCRAGRPAE